MIVEMSGDLKATKALMESFVYYTFPEHVKDDNHTRAIANKVSGKVSRMFWSIGGAITLLAAAEGARALGWIA